MFHRDIQTRDMSETNTRYARDMKHERAARMVLPIDFRCLDILYIVVYIAPQTSIIMIEYLM